MSAYDNVTRRLIAKLPYRALARRGNKTCQVIAPFHVDDVVTWRCEQALKAGSVIANSAANTKYRIRSLVIKRDKTTSQMWV